MTDTLQPRSTPGPPATEQARIIDTRLQQVGSTWYALGQTVGVSRSYMSHIKSGRANMGDDVLERVADVLNLDADRLYLAAGKVPPDVIETLRDHPQLITAVRKARQKMETQT